MVIGFLNAGRVAGKVAFLLETSWSLRTTKIPRSRHARKPLL